MSSTDELFHNGQIRPMRLSSFLLRPQALPPLADLSVHRRSHSLAPSRTHWLSPSTSPAPAAASKEQAAAVPSASWSSSSSSRSSRRWGFLKDLLHRSKFDGSKHPPPPSKPPLLPAPKRNPSPVAARVRGRRRSVHKRLYEARWAEAEEMRRCTFLPYWQGLLLGCLGLSSRGYGAMHSLATAAKSRS